jgi:hypothetical protein
MEGAYHTPWRVEDPNKNSLDYPAAYFVYVSFCSVVLIRVSGVSRWPLIK